MKGPPSIAVLLGTHHGGSDGHEDGMEHEDDGEDGDLDEHGETLMQEFCDAYEKGDHKAMWSIFKKAAEMAEHAEGEDGEDGDGAEEDEGDHDGY